MTISEMLNKDYNITRVPLYLKDGARYTHMAVFSPETLVKGKELVNSIAALDLEIAKLQEAKRNAEAVLDETIVGAIDPNYSSSASYQIKYITANNS